MYPKVEHIQPSDTCVESSACRAMHNRQCGLSIKL